MNLSPQAEPLLRRAAFNGTKVVASRHVHTLLAEDEHPVSGKQLPSAIDQHAWLDPRNGVIYVRNVQMGARVIPPMRSAIARTRRQYGANPSGRRVGAQGTHCGAKPASGAC